MTPNPSRDGTTPRPLIEHDATERWLVENDGDGASRIVAQNVSRLHGAAIVEAVNAYDRLRAIEAAARRLVESAASLVTEDDDGETAEFWYVPPQPLELAREALAQQSTPESRDE